MERLNQLLRLSEFSSIFPLSDFFFLTVEVKQFLGVPQKGSGLSKKKFVPFFYRLSIFLVFFTSEYPGTHIRVTFCHSETGLKAFIQSQGSVESAAKILSIFNMIGYPLQYILGTCVYFFQFQYNILLHVVLLARQQENA